MSLTAYRPYRLEGGSSIFGRGFFDLRGRRSKIDGGFFDLRRRKIEEPPSSIFDVRIRRSKKSQNIGSSAPKIKFDLRIRRYSVEDRHRPREFLSFDLIFSNVYFIKSVWRETKMRRLTGQQSETKSGYRSANKSLM